MQDFVDMAEAHAWTLQRLREMAGRLTEQAYLRACAAGVDNEMTATDPEAEARWMLVFDRMARGLRLSIALEAKLARERRADAAQIADEIAEEIADGIAGVARPEPGAGRGEAAGPRSAAADRQAADRAAAHRQADDEPCERDREYDAGLAGDAPLRERIARLKALVEGAAACAPVPWRLRFEDAPRERAAQIPPEAPSPDAAWSLPAAAPIPPAARSAPPPWRGSG